MSTTRHFLGKVIAIATIAAAFALGAFVLVRLDQRPRTHDAFLFADTTAIAPEVNGRITKILVRENQRVRKDEPLAEIDREPYELRLRQVRAQVEALQAQIDLTGRQVTSQASGADVAATQIGRAKAQVALARDTRKRLEPMLGQGFVTEQQVDEARTNERSAEVVLQAAIQQATQARQAVGDTQSLTAQLRGAEAALALAERDLRYTTLRAPFDGQVTGLEIAEGTYAVTGHPLFTLIDTSHWYAVADFRETELPYIHAGDPAHVWTMADASQGLPGHVESLGGGVRPNNAGAPGLPSVERSLKWVIVAQRFPVRVLLDGPAQESWRIGTTVSVVVSHRNDR